MNEIQLVQLDPTIEASLMSDPSYIEAMRGEDWDRVAGLALERIGRTLDAEPDRVDQLAWSGYAVVDAGTHEVVGSCAFKGPPTEEGEVEIAYFTYPGFEGRGYATRMACQLIGLASSSPAVQRVVAHTLPEKNASTRVLEKAEMAFVGEVVDPEDGTVWRWQATVKV